MAVIVGQLPLSLVSLFGCYRIPEFFVGDRVLCAEKGTHVFVVAIPFFANDLVACIREPGVVSGHVVVEIVQGFALNVVFEL